MIQGVLAKAKASWPSGDLAELGREALSSCSAACRGSARDLGRSLLSAAFSVATRGGGAAHLNRPRGEPVRLGWICGEFFHEDAGGFGGLGRTVKNIADHYNREDASGPRVDLFLPRHDNCATHSEVTRIHDTDVVRIPRLKRLARHPGRHLRVVGSRLPDVFVTMGFLPGYEYVLWAAPRTPLIVYLRDPRGEAEWRQIERAAPLDGEVETRGRRADLLRLAEEHRSSFARVCRQSRRAGRRIVFASNADCLVERASRKLGIPDLTAWPLPSPIPIPALNGVSEAPDPTLLWLGRLDPVKRPEVVVALARRLPGVRFVLAGQSHHAELMRPVLEAASKLANVELAGLVQGAAKEALLRSCWAVVNTSAHEGVPVSFLEAFSYAKPVISYHNPDGLLDRFGYPCGPVLSSDGTISPLGRFEAAIDACLRDAGERHRRGAAGRDYVRANHTFEIFDRRLRTIVQQEALIPRDRPWRRDT